MWRMIGDAFYQFPIDYVREQFPALKRIYNNRSVIYLDGPEGSQMVRGSIEAMSNYMSKGCANLYGEFPSSKETKDMVLEAKKSVAEMLGAKEKEIVFGANVTTLEFAISRLIAKDLKPGDEIVLSEMDHRANVEPWLSIAKDKGLIVRWFKANISNLTLDLSEMYSVITEKTRIVAIGLASNAIGTVNEVEIIADRAKAVGAILIVDAAHAAPHFFIEYNKLGADIFFCSVYKFFGPHVGIAIIKESISKRWVEMSPNHIVDQPETGTLNYEGIAGIKAAVDFIASLGRGETEKEKIMSAFKQIEAYENRLASKIRKRLSKMSKIIMYQAPEWSRKTPTIAFRIDGMTSQQVCRWMAEENSVFITNGDFYTAVLADKLGIHKDDGWIRVGIAPYNTEEEVEFFISTIKKLVNR